MTKKTNKKKTKSNFKNKKLIIGLILFIIIIIAIIIGFTASSNENAFPKVKEETPQEEVKKLQIVNEDSTTRPYAIMINNLSIARPYHSGLQEAYLTYEFLVEGGITRYLALYKDANVDRIGPVRSARHYYLDYAMENDAYYVHYGWSPQAQSDISSYSINNINGLYYDKYFWRDNSLKVASEHTVFTSTEKLAPAASNLKYRTETNKKLLLNYSIENIDLTNSDAIDAKNVKISYTASNNTSYTYDEENQVYLRYVNGTPHTDYVTKNQYTVKNIIIYQVSSSVIDSSGRLNLNNVGSGKGYYITNGKAITITWEKTSRSAQTIYKDSEGKEIILNDGNTYIQIFPTNQTYTIS